MDDVEEFMQRPCDLGACVAVHLQFCYLQVGSVKHRAPVVNALIYLFVDYAYPQAPKHAKVEGGGWN